MLHVSLPFVHSQKRCLLVSLAKWHASQVDSVSTCLWQRLSFVGRILQQAFQVKVLTLFGIRSPQMMRWNNLWVSPSDDSAVAKL